MELGIALSGGGARGVAHVGVLQALEEAGLSPRCLSGASAGAIVGVLYAAGHSPEEILRIFKNTPLTQLLRLSLPLRGLIDTTPLLEALRRYVAAEDFGDLERRLFVSVTNLTEGRFEIVSQGPLLEYVAASAAVPLLFKPRKLQGDQYVDGGVLNNLPVEPLLECCDLVVGVNVTPIRACPDAEGLLRVAGRTLDLVMWSNVEARLRQCDLAIEPDAAGFGLFEVGRVEEIFSRGYEAAKARLPELEKMMV